MTPTETRTPILENQQKKVFRTVKQEEPLVVKRAPHIHSAITPAARNWVTFIALIPAIAVSGIFSGVSALSAIFNCIAAFVVFEFLLEKILKQKVRIWDGSSVLFGAVLGLMLNPAVPFWMCWVGALLGFIAKNRFHPSMFGLMMLLFLFPVSLNQSESFISNMFVQIALIAGGVFLAAKRIIRWENAVMYILASIFSAVFSLFSGAILLAGIFVVTDSRTTPLTLKGNIVFSAMAGILSMTLGMVTGSLEGIVFGILIMNGLVPLIDRCVRIRPFIRVGSL